MAESDSVLEGELVETAQRLLGMVLRVALVVLPVLLAATALLRTWQEAAGVGVLVAATGGVYLLLRARRLALALQSFIGALILYGCIGVTIYGSIRSAAALAFVAAIVISGIFLNPRFLAGVTTVCATAVGALVWAESAGVWPRPSFSVGPHTWLSYSTVLAALGFITYYGRSLIVAALARAREENAERVRAQAALRASEERFSRVFFALPVNLTISRVSDGRFLEANALPERPLGYTRDELIGRSATELGFWADARARAPFVALLERDGRVAGYEARMRHKSGEMTDCRIWATQIDLEGETCVLSSILNVTEQKRREALLLDVAQGVAAVAGQDFFQRMTLHFARVLRADAAVAGEITPARRVHSLAEVRDGNLTSGITYDLEGTPCATTLEAPGPRIIPDRVAELYPGDAWLTGIGARAFVGACLREPDGEPIGMLVAAFRAPLESTEALDPLFRIFAARAQSELQRLRHDRLVEGLNASLEQRVQERTAQLESAVRELEAFSYSVSHDLRAPLRAIGSFAHLLAEGERKTLSDEGRRRLDVIEANAVRMGKLIDELLQLARVPRAELRRERVDLALIALPLVETLSTAYPGTEVQIGDRMPAALGDATLLLQALANLLDNAFKFSQRAASPRVELGWSEAQRAWYVRDNGIGFDMEHAGKLFGTFERLHTEREFPGTGVGLAIVKRILERHGGRVWAEGTPERGATFYFQTETAAAQSESPRLRTGRRPGSASRGPG